MARLLCFYCGCQTCSHYSKGGASCILSFSLSPAPLVVFFFAEATKRPPWGTSLGGEIYIHGGGNAPDWTAGCIALSDADMAVLFAMAREGDTVRIIP